MGGVMMNGVRKMESVAMKDNVFLKINYGSGYGFL